ncbi:MAG TPA: amidase family protein [Chloroflexota bacterium]|nr:amidase family protein [Chloroflexota bacterium]
MATRTVLDVFGPARAMLAALAEKAVSSVELTELHLARIARYNPALNAIVVPAADPRAVAAEADAAIARGDDRRLLGMPVTLKESMNVRGLPTTVGVPDWATYRATDDGAIAARVLGAGGVLLGKTNIPPMLADWQANNPIYGRTVNPWDAALTPGGSTGGGAAAVAAGLSPLEFGSDIGGSIRVPAAFCGIFGHKPSETAVPRSGQFPFPVRPNAASVMGVQGPLARSAEDLELGLDVVMGPEVGEDVGWRLQLPAPRGQRLADLRVAIMPRLDWLPVSAEILAALDTLASRLSGAGARVGSAAPESFGDLRAHHEVYLSMLTALTSGPLSREEREQRAERTANRADDEWRAARALGISASVGDWGGLHGKREAYRAAYRDFFREWDVLLAPIVLRTAFPHVDDPWPPVDDAPMLVVEVDGQQIPYGNQLVYPALATLSGQPATAFPVGLSRGGLPLGLQAIGPYLEDRTPIRFAALASQLMGGTVRPPGYDA